MFGLLYNIRPKPPTVYPIRYPELCVFLALTDCRGQGEEWIVCENEDTGQRVFASRRRPITFGPDRLEVIGVPFRVRACPFPGRACTRSSSGIMIPGSITAC